jgi:hypothetical protein
MDERMSKDARLEPPVRCLRYGWVGKRYPVPTYTGPGCPMCGGQLEHAEETGGPQDGKEQGRPSA